ncbi:MAG: NUDIX domain-containing protein [Verrucomicrobia bacterium]|nr:NUDIX domain-containing protein [Verrucomicrobiota bacterium]
MIRNVIFDWSGTLVDDLPAVWRASNHALQQAGVPAMPLEEFRREFRLPARDFYMERVPKESLPELEGWFLEGFKLAQDTVTPLPHAREFLEFCRQHGLRTFLLSAVHPALFAQQEKISGFGPFLDKTYLGAHDKKDLIGQILRDNELDPTQTVFIGDMQHDIETAHHGGVKSVAVLTGYDSLDKLRKSKPDLIVEHLSELRRHLEANQLCLKPGPAPRSAFPIPTVGALIRDDSGRMLLFKTAKWSGMWGIPGGKIEWGEPSEEALRREVREETGLEIERIQFVMVQDSIASTEFYREAHFILLNYTCLALPGQSVTLNGEAQEFVWVHWEQAFELPLNTPTRRLLEIVRAL